jgi:hypothetical protein
VEVAVVGSGVAAQEIERRVDRDTEALGEHSFGLLNSDPAGQRELELSSRASMLVDSPLIGQPDCGRGRQ